MRLAYRAYEKSGREVTDVIDAPGPAEAAETLRRQELFVTDISAAPDGPAQPAARQRVRRGTHRLKELAVFTRQLYVLLRAGTPLVEGLRALERQTQSASWREVVAEVRKRLEQGQPLSSAMASRPQAFDTVYRNMIAAGESSGKLPAVLDRLTRLIRRRLHVRRTVLSAMIYPCLLITITVGVLVVMLTMVIPRFAILFQSLDVPLPPTTAALIAISNGLRSYWWAVLGGVAAIVGAVVVIGRAETGNRLRDTLALKVPYVGRLVRSFATAQITRLLGVLLDSHLPVLEALYLTRNVVWNVHYAELLGRAQEAVTHGQPISTAFRDTDLISPSVYEATRSGEQSGQVSALLLDLADLLDEENEIALKGLISVLEPSLLILMGLVVAVVALSIFTPLFDAAGLVGAG